MSSVYLHKLNLSKKYSIQELKENFKSGKVSCVKDSLTFNVFTIKMYQLKCHVPNFENFVKAFPKISLKNMEVYWKFLDFDRDFVFSTAGVHLLEHRYLNEFEPIQFGLMRLALILSDSMDFDTVEVIYDALSTGSLCVSSILGDSVIDACKLYVLKPNYDRDLLKQIFEIEQTVALGTGVGLSAENLPAQGKDGLGFIKNGFYKLIQHLNNSGNLTICERTPKIAIYLPIYNDTVLDALEMCSIHVNIKNVFFALNINDYFMKCVSNDEDWHLFSGDLIVDGESLHAKSGSEFEFLYKKFVELNLYVRKMSAREMWSKIVDSIATSRGVYIIYIDTVNTYQNTQHLGRVKTLNLCSEITNFASPEEPSNCTLITVNLSQFNVFPENENAIKKFLLKHFNVSVEDYCDSFKWTDTNVVRKRLIEYTFIMGMLSCIILNIRIGKRKNREIGISPMGLYDLSIILDEDIKELSSVLSESLYKGSIVGSISYAKKYNVICSRYIGSKFQLGQPQWFLRNENTNSNWSRVMEDMTHGMANSALTCCAPTASTSLLVDCVESILVPIDNVLLRKSRNGSNKVFSSGYTFRCLNDNKYNFKNSKAYVEKCKNVDVQLLVFKNSAPFIDHSQSTIYNIQLDNQEISSVLKKAYDYKLKTGIYYGEGRSHSASISIIDRFCDGGACSM